MASKIKPPLNLGILGGGQLARMLALAAHKAGYHVHIYSESPLDPAALVTTFHYKNSLQDKSSLQKFIEKMDVVTFESEFLNAEMLGQINKKQNKIFPHPELMGLLQDRKTQKELLNKYKLPTSPWINIENEDELFHVLENLEVPLVLKKRRFGYDGYGTYVVRNEADALHWQKHFQSSPELKSQKYIAEQFIPFTRELACIFVRNQSGDVSHFPLVESLQKNSRCFWVKGPIKHPQFAKLAQKIKKFLSQINYVGVMGVELFETKKELLINELAPRVHNSGHYTMDAFALDQFDLHLRAISDQPIEIPKSPHGGYAMVNLLGDSQTNPSWKNPDDDTIIHWYGKSENRPGRKMGHINSVGSNGKKALKKALKVREKVHL